MYASITKKKGISLKDIQSEARSSLLWDLWAHSMPTYKSMLVMLDNGFTVSYETYRAEMKARDQQFMKDMDLL